ncbi:MAG: adenylate/guanylate cyclase domain-containing protein [bacterium]
MSELLILSEYSFNPYAIPPVLTAAAMQALAIFVVSYERGTRNSWIFFCMCSIMNIWLMSSAMMYFSASSRIALVWAKVLYFGVCFIPAVIYTFTVNILDYSDWKLTISHVGWGISTLFAATLVIVPQTIEGVYKYQWGYYPNYGIIQGVFLLYFGSILTLNLLLYWFEASRSSTKPGAQKRYQTFMVGFAVAYLASMDFLPAFGYALYPFGYIFIVLFCFILALGIWRYRLVDFTPAFVANEMLYTINDPLIVCDIDGTIRMTNQATESVLGYSEEKLIDQPMSRLFTDSGVDLAFPTDVPRPDEGSNLRAIRTGHGEIITADISRSQLSDQQGNTIGSVIVIRDLSEIVNERAKISLLQHISEAANEAESIDSAFEITLEAICDFMEWDMAHVFRKDNIESEELSPIQTTIGAETTGMAEFIEITKETSLREEPDLSELFENQTAVTVPELSETDIAHLSVLSDSGFSSALFFPITVSDEVVAVLEFFTRKPIDYDEETEEILDYTAHQLSRVIERDRARAVEKAFRHYVPSSVMKRALENPESLQLGGNRREITVLFADLAQFTTFSQDRSAKEVAYVLNQVLTQITGCVFDHDGVLDKYIGDALLAEFGILPDFEPGNHARRACLAALDMIDAMDKLHNQWDDKEKKQLKLKLGIHTGEAATGNMGSEILFDFTAVGDTMNTGAMLEQANKKFGSYCLISQSTYDRVKDIVETRCLGEILFKEHSVPITVYELLGRSSELNDETRTMVSTFEKGLREYQNREWKSALETFRDLSRHHPEDQAVQLYKQRSRQYSESPPASDWIPAEEINP